MYDTPKINNPMTRGIRNNNPLNIRCNGDLFRGEVRPGTDPAFKQFESMEYGYRAAFKMLDTYRRKHGCRVLADFIGRWAPPAENDTNAYLKAVCRRTKLADVSTVDTLSETQMRSIVAAMSFVENGIEADREQVRIGWNLFINDRS